MMTAPFSAFGRILAHWHRAFGERPVTVSQADTRLRLGEVRLRAALRRAGRREFGGYVVRRGGYDSTAGLMRWRVEQVKP